MLIPGLAHSQTFYWSPYTSRTETTPDSVKVTRSAAEKRSFQADGKFISLSNLNHWNEN